MARIVPDSGARKNATSAAITYFGFAGVLAGLYFAKAILVPFALALLFAFVLTPAVLKLQRVGFGRAPAVLFAVLVTLGTLTVGSWLVTLQMVDLAEQLPKYKDNIHRKLEAMSGPNKGVIGKLSDAVQQLGDEFTAKRAAADQSKPVRVEVVEHSRNIFESASHVIGPLMKPLETVVIVVIFTIFMLLERESLRNRLLRLVGQGQLTLATEALNDAAGRVSKFLLMQFVVNTTFGLLFGAGLWVIGVPNALLFGVFAAVFRFVPYVGTLAAGSLPLILSFAVFDGFKQPLIVLGLFLFIELTTANVVEPWLYGSHTGISSLAILVAAVFWASLWGPVGLILSTPLTVCLVVIGKHVSQLQFLNVLLGDDPVLLPAERYYQRLLALDADEARSVLQDAVKKTTLAEAYDDVVLTAMAMAEQDRYRNDLNPASMDFICQSTSEIVEELGSSAPAEETPHPSIDRKVMCFGADDFADEVTASMLAQLLSREGYVALPFGTNPSPVHVLEQFSDGSKDIVCLCALPPLALMHARTKVKQIRERYPDVSVVVCLWGMMDAQLARIQRLIPETIVMSFAGAVKEIAVLTGASEPNQVVDENEVVRQ